ncbi:MAG: valine--tRNA ligase [Planctomycetes bacterium]|nr:valine--tRNA ligase [Planctomycetota bacterium]MBU1517878.1 valine--tRNA ligase [Planctomycetota bacterium]MBU2458014.1 valine--tRNA ligase [Planctomycetota bacterium]
MTEELSKVYEPKQIEALADEIWQKGNYFHTEPPAKGGRKTKAYTIVIPPPNVTGALHLGHAIDNTLQDVLVRFKRMQGFNTLWLPGTDHAGIATQSVVEKNLKAEKGQNRHDIGREKLVELIWDWKKQYGNRILEQLKRMGASCDWDRTRFTLDEMCAKAVRHTFVNLFKKGLIYRGKRLVNWDSVLQTAVSDDEVVHKTVQGNFWYIHYPLVDPSQSAAAGGGGFITIATTRPETMLGDTAVAVNPKDKRAKKFVGKMVHLPLTGRQIPIISDDYVKLGEGTGFLKVTPAHDPNDYEIGLRGKLEMINILTPDGKINENGGKYAGLDRYEARRKIVEDLKTQNLLEKVEPHEHEVGHSDRSGDIIEPYLSDQWFVKVGPLAKKAIKAVESGKIKFHPERFAKTYLDWLYGIRDWCISRQLWWGHRIPIWYCEKCGHNNTGIEDPAECEKCKSNQLRQDEDVLDTWFSSALWPHSTLGWPEQTEELKFYYPTNTLVTARDIITLWVSRMVMMGLENMGEVPFKDVFIHPTILDGNGERMSKSKGNGIDPIDIIETYGADAMRFSLCQMTTESQDLKLPVIKDEKGRNISDKFDIGRNFCNKLWNASRFAMMNLEGIDFEAFDVKKMTITDKWILSRLAQTIKEVTAMLDSFQISEPLMVIYRFFWNDLCDWYLEWSKPRMRDSAQKQIPQNVLAFVLDCTLRLLHPFVPFITEGVFQKLNEIAPKRGLKGIIELGTADALVIADWPMDLDNFADRKTEKQIEVVQEVVRAIREIRNKYTVGPSKKLTASANAPSDISKILNASAELVCDRAGLDKFGASPKEVKPDDAAATVIGKIQVFVQGLIDAEAEIQRLEKQKNEILAGVKSNEAKLNNENFVSRAKPEVVEQTRKRLAELKQQLEMIEKNLAELK